MVPAGNLSKRNHLPRHGGGGGGLNIYGCSGGGCAENLGLIRYEYRTEACLGSDLGANNMADDASRTNSLNEVGSSSKDYNHQEEEEKGDEGWLQLSIGGHHATRNHHGKHDHGGRLTGLDLFPGGGSHRERPHMPEFRAPIHPLVMQGSPTSLFLQQQEEGSSSNTFRLIGAAGSSSSSVPSGSYFTRLFQLQPGIDVARPSSNVRIIDSPRRPHSGIWAKEPFLPQIPKSYLRIKDGKMTVRSVMKYLVNKLSLDSESERHDRNLRTKRICQTVLVRIRDSP
ncbi:Detected protein of unknown function [Hibiscus syriacus]|uniref:Uncharacterized protein n=1 Tax=Hibiscus syriacus TaxID=106335 RepID=A0A6A3AGL9_HIBSY|nr:Detected protein of unknown function [Hibiscus syriacus]